MRFGEVAGRAPGGLPRVRRRGLLVQEHVHVLPADALPGRVENAHDDPKGLVRAIPAFSSHDPLQRFSSEWTFLQRPRADSPRDAFCAVTKACPFSTRMTWTWATFGVTLNS